MSKNLFLDQQIKNEKNQEKKIDSTKCLTNPGNFTLRKIFIRVEKRGMAKIDNKRATIKARRRIEIYLRKFIKA